MTASRQATRAESEGRSIYIYRPLCHQPSCYALLKFITVLTEFTKQIRNGSDYGYDTQDYWGFGLCPSSLPLKNTTFRNLNLFTSGVKRGRQLLCCVKVKVILRSTVSRPFCSGIRSSSGTRDCFFFLFHRNYPQIFVVLIVERPLTRGQSVVYWYKCYWALPALTLPGPSHAGLVTISYCLI
jgi:hypothetical protein